MQIKCLIKKIGLTFIGIIIFQTIFAQENYLPGYIINLKGDTIRGFVDYRNWGTNPGSISFKENIGNNQDIYKPSDIIEFSVMDEVYVSGLIQ